MTALIVTTAVATVLAVAIVAAVKNLWTHRHTPHRMLGGVPARLWHRLRVRHRKKKAEGPDDATRFWDMANSDDPDIWKPVT